VDGWQDSRLGAELDDEKKKKTKNTNQKKKGKERASKRPPCASSVWGFKQKKGRGLKEKDSPKRRHRGSSGREVIESSSA